MERRWLTVPGGDWVFVEAGLDPKDGEWLYVGRVICFVVDLGDDGDGQVGEELDASATAMVARNDGEGLNVITPLESCANTEIVALVHESDLPAAILEMARPGLPGVRVPELAKEAFERLRAKAKK